MERDERIQKLEQIMDNCLNYLAHSLEGKINKISSKDMKTIQATYDWAKGELNQLKNLSEESDQ